MEDELIIKYDLGNNDKPNRFIVRKKFWQYLLPKLSKVTPQFDQISPNSDAWLLAGAGVVGIYYGCVSTKFEARLEFLIATASLERNKRLFKFLEKNKSSIEDVFGNAMDWSEMPNTKMSIVKFHKTDVFIYSETDWTEMSDFFCAYLPKFIKAFEGYSDAMKEK